MREEQHQDNHKHHNAHHVQDVRECILDPYAHNAGGDEQGDRQGRRYRAGSDREHEDNAEMHRIHAHAGHKGQQNGSEQDDDRGAFHERAQHQQEAYDQEVDGNGRARDG